MKKKKVLYSKLQIKSIVNISWSHVTCVIYKLIIMEKN